MESYDVIIIGTGAGGGTLAHRLAPSGKRILILERGGFLPREKQNWESAEVFLKARYHTSEMWRGKKGRKFMPVMIAMHHGTLKPRLGIFAGLLLLVYITFEAPFSGMSLNPARTLASALPARNWKAIWIYFTAPVLAMLLAAILFGD